MPPPAAKKETEIKIWMPDAAQARKLLRRCGFRVSRRRVYERNIVFDSPDGALRRRGFLLRLRRSGDQATLTFKGRGSSGKYKMRTELESAVHNPEAIERIFAALGLNPVFRYEKHRTEYSKGRSGGHVCLDETPAGVFLELEGPPGWIDQTANALGFSASHYITATYGKIYQHAEAFRSELYEKYQREGRIRGLG